MARRAAVNIVERNPETGLPEVFAAGDPVPAWAAELVTNPEVWGEDDEDDAADDLPPKGGSGSGIEAWAAYAEAHGIDVPPDASRDDVIAAVESAT